MFNFGLDVPVTGGSNINNSWDPVGNFLNRAYTRQSEIEDQRTARNTATANRLSLEHEAASFNQRMTLAREQGLHPLSVMGVNMSQGVSTPHISAHGGTASVGLRPGTSDHEREMQGYDRRIGAANASIAEDQAAMSRTNLQNQFLRGQPSNENAYESAVRRASGLPAGSVSSDAPGGANTGNFNPVVVKPESVTAPSLNHAGTTAGQHSLFTRVTGKDGKTYYIPNPDLNIEPERFGDLAVLSGNTGIPLEYLIAGDAVSQLMPLAAGIAAPIYLGGRAIVKHYAGKAINKAAAIAQREKSRISRLRQMQKGGK